MKTARQNSVPRLTGVEIYRRSRARGLKCYRIAPLWNFLWIPWDKKVIFILDTDEIKQYFGLRTKNDLLDFYWHCTNHQKYLEVPESIEKILPMPEPDPGARFPDTKDLMTWAQKVLSITNP